MTQSYTIEVLRTVSRGSGKDDGRATQQMLLAFRESRLKSGGEGSLRVIIDERLVEAAGVETELAGFSNLLMARDF